MPKPTDQKIKSVYNSIAEGFYNLRQQPITPEIIKLSESWKPGKLLEIGCGIGNSLPAFIKNNFDCAGIDLSSRMIKNAKRFAEKNLMEFSLEVASALWLPFKDKQFDYIISIAVLHHLDSEQKRLQALSEMKRVLKPERKILFTVWNKPNAKKKDTCIEWTRKEKPYKRYYHFFGKKEMVGLLEKAGFTKYKIFEDGKKKNLCVLVSE